MAYITPAQLRPGTATWPDLVLDERDVRFETSGGDTDALLTAAIAAWSAEFDAATGDHFETVSSGPDVLVVGTGTTILPVCYRIISFTSLDQIDREGTATALGTSIYRVGTSWLERLDGLGWNVRYTYRLNDLSYGWPTTPHAVKRAVALLVWDALKAQGGGRHLARRWVAGDTEFEADRDPDDSFGIPEVDRVVRRYRLRYPRVAAV